MTYFTFYLSAWNEVIAKFKSQTGKDIDREKIKRKYYAEKANEKVKTKLGCII